MNNKIYFLYGKDTIISLMNQISIYAFVPYSMQIFDNPLIVKEVSYGEARTILGWEPKKLDMSAYDKTAIFKGLSGEEIHQRLRAKVVDQDILIFLDRCFERAVQVGHR